MTGRPGSRLVALAIAAVLAAGCGVPPIADMEYAWSEYRRAQRQPTPPDPVVMGEAERGLNEAQDLLDQEEWEAAGQRFREAGRLAAAAREHRDVPGLGPSSETEPDAPAEASLPLPRAPRPEPEPAPARAPDPPEVPVARAPVAAAAGAGAAVAAAALPEPGSRRAPSEVVPRDEIAPAPPPAAAPRRAGEVVPAERVDEPRVVGDAPSSLGRRSPRSEAAVPPLEELRSEELERPAAPAPPAPPAPPEAPEAAAEPTPPADPEEVARRIAQKEVAEASARLAESGSAAPPEGVPPAPPPPAADEGGGRIYVVGSGETLWTIAGKVYGDRAEWSRIYEANRDQIPDPSQVYAGQKLVLPGLDAEPAAAPTPPQPEGPRMHVLGRGETLRSVAERYYGDAELWTVIYEANRARIGDPDRVRAGLELTVPPRR